MKEHEIPYRGYIIHPNYCATAIPKSCGADWMFSHKDYDLDDNRIGYGPNIDDCKRQIDEMIEEEGDE